MFFTIDILKQVLVHSSYPSVMWGKLSEATGQLADSSFGLKEETEHIKFGLFSSEHISGEILGSMYQLINLFLCCNQQTQLNVFLCDSPTLAKTFSCTLSQDGSITSFKHWQVFLIKLTRWHGKIHYNLHHCDSSLVLFNRHYINTLKWKTNKWIHWTFYHSW